MTEFVLTLLLLEYGFGAVRKIIFSPARPHVLTLLLLEYGFGAFPNRPVGRVVFIPEYLTPLFRSI
jgi:hypothetical protein